MRTTPIASTSAAAAPKAPVVSAGNPDYLAQAQVALRAVEEAAAKSAAEYARAIAAMPKPGSREDNNITLLKITELKGKFQAQFGADALEKFKAVFERATEQMQVPLASMYSLQRGQAVVLSREDRARELNEVRQGDVHGVDLSRAVREDHLSLTSHYLSKASEALKEREAQAALAAVEIRRQCMALAARTDLNGPGKGEEYRKIVAEFKSQYPDLYIKYSETFNKLIVDSLFVQFPSRPASSVASQSMSVSHSESSSAPADQVSQSASVSVSSSALASANPMPAVQPVLVQPSASSSASAADLAKAPSAEEQRRADFLRDLEERAALNHNAPVQSESTAADQVSQPASVSVSSSASASAVPMPAVQPLVVPAQGRISRAIGVVSSIFSGISAMFSGCRRSRPATTGSIII